MLAIKTKAIAAQEINTFEFTVGLYGIGTDGGMWHRIWGDVVGLPLNPGWVSVGGRFDSAPATSISPSPSFAPWPAEVFGLGTDDQMFHRTVSYTSWPPPEQAWQPLGGIFNGPPVALAFGPAREKVAIVGLFPDNQPRLKLLTVGDHPDVDKWLPSDSDWLPLGGTLIYEPAIAYIGPQDSEVIAVFGVGTDRQMFQLTIDASQWPPTLSGWVGVGGCFASPPAVAQWGPNRIDIFGLGMDMQMFHRPWDNGNWLHDWAGIGGNFDSIPAVVSWDSNRLDIFGLGTDDQMYHRAWDGNEWIPAGWWEPLGQPTTGPFTTAPTAFSRFPNTLQIFALGADFQLYRKAWDGNRWLPSPSGWEPLGGTFIIPRPTQLPGQLDFDWPITFSDDTPVGGWLHVTLFSDGRSNFSGHMHDSGFPSYACSVGCAVIDHAGRAYTFEEFGHLWGTDLPGSRDRDWNVATPPNLTLRDNWADLFDCGGSKFGAKVVVQTYPPGGLIHVAPIVLQELSAGAPLTVIPLVGNRRGPMTQLGVYMLSGPYRGQRRENLLEERPHRRTPRPRIGRPR